MTIEVPEGDPLREYTVDEVALLTRNLAALIRRVHAGEFSNRLISVDLFNELHRSLFGSVRDHAGKHRTRGFGSEHLCFGPIRSISRNEVSRQLAQLAQEAERICAMQSVLSSSPLPPGSLDEGRRTLAALREIARIHARFVKVHPYEDGNGRIGRAVMSMMLVRIGLTPIPIEVPKQEYLDALNAFHQQGDMDPLVDLLLRIGASSAPG